jgi:3-oxoacyl-[acyl-carrier protein] reductase
MPRLKDRIAVITGSGAGMGEGIARLFAEEGASVVISDLDKHNGDAVAASIAAQGQHAVFQHADVRIEADCRALIDRAVKVFGRIDVLVNNAGGGSGVEGGVGPLEEATPEGFDAVYQLNLRSPFFTGMRAAKYMIEQGTGGSILNIVSIDGLFPAPGEALYGSAKAALISLTASLAVELGRYRIRVNAIAPGLVDTKLVARALHTEEQRIDRASFSAINRVGKPEDIAAAAVYLCSDEAEWVSGETLLAAGGQKATSDIFRWLRQHNPVPEGARI